MDNNKLIPVNSSVALAKTSVALSITDKLTFNQNRKMVKEIFLSNKEFFINVISEYYTLNEFLLEEYKDEWSWGKLSRNTSLPWSESFIERYIDKWNWKNLSYNTSLPWSDDFIDKYVKRWDWNSL